MAVQKSHRSKGKKTLRNNLEIFKKNYPKKIKKTEIKKLVYTNTIKLF